MSLVKCPECGKKVSSLTDKCPNCGFPMGEIPANEVSEDKIIVKDAANKKALSKKRISLFVVAAIVVIGAFIGCLLAKQNERQKLATYSVQEFYKMTSGGSSYPDKPWRELELNTRADIAIAETLVDESNLDETHAFMEKRFLADPDKFYPDIKKNITSSSAGHEGYTNRSCVGSERKISSRSLKKCSVQDGIHLAAYTFVDIFEVNNDYCIVGIRYGANKGKIVYVCTEYLNER